MSEKARKQCFQLFFHLFIYLIIEYQNSLGKIPQKILQHNKYIVVVDVTKMTG